MQILLSALVEDFSIYPRHAVDESNIAGMVQALKSGATLPRIAIDRKSKRISDGFHRKRAQVRFLGPDGKVDVEVIDYKDEAELLRDAIRRNAAHGKRMDTIDQVRAIALCQQRGISLEEVAVELHMTEERVRKLSVRLATVERNLERPSAVGLGTIPGGMEVALKRPALHLSGSTLTEAQAIAHKSAPGTSYLLLCSQLRDGLRYGLVNTADERVLVALRELEKELAGFLAGHS